MTHARFQTVKVEDGLLPYVVIDIDTNETLVWCNNPKEAEIVKTDYNRIYNQDRILEECMKNLKLYEA